LLGDMQAVQKQSPQAAANYRAAFEREPSAQLAVRLYRASRLAGEGKAALASIERWNASGPGDIYADNVLADAYLGEGELEKARQLYEKILHTRPNQP
ncbi:MAG: hypothetical protein N2544_17710, partial [Burkholderiales bacterium]|nr:hypothetical protein [Burkholderiales bacterium]